MPYSPPDMSADALMAYARGWLDGYERAHAEGFSEGVDAAHEHWTECVRRANRRSEQAGNAKAWRRRVLEENGDLT